MELEVYNPAGAVRASQTHAPRLDTLSGRTICEVSNAMWETHRTFPLIRELLQARFPDATVVPYTEFPSGSHFIDVEGIGEALQKKGCQAVIGGNSA
ncbi:MAG: hypothetical protein HYX92_11190 [Chloroflexi bacterium]|nr:hypothetical protein [Chloroflexota bacterium]